MNYCVGDRFAHGEFREIFYLDLLPVWQGQRRHVPSRLNELQRSSVHDEERPVQTLNGGPVSSLGRFVLINNLLITLSAILARKPLARTAEPTLSATTCR